MQQTLTSEEQDAVFDYACEVRAKMLKGEITDVVATDLYDIVPPCSDEQMKAMALDVLSESSGITKRNPVDHFKFRTGDDVYDCVRCDGKPFYSNPKNMLLEGDVNTGDQLEIMAQDLSKTIGKPTLGIILMTNHTLQERSGNQYVGHSFLDNSAP